MKRNLGIQTFSLRCSYIQEYSGASGAAVEALSRFVDIQVLAPTSPSASRVLALQFGTCRRPSRRPSIQTDDASFRVSPCYYSLLRSVPIQASASRLAGGRIV